MLVSRSRSRSVRAPASLAPRAEPSTTTPARAGAGSAAGLIQLAAPASAAPAASGAAEVRSGAPGGSAAGPQARSLWPAGTLREEEVTILSSSSEESTWSDQVVQTSHRVCTSCLPSGAVVRAFQSEAPGRQAFLVYAGRDIARQRAIHRAARRSFLRWRRAH